MKKQTKQLFLTQTAKKNRTQKPKHRALYHSRALSCLLSNDINSISFLFFSLLPGSMSPPYLISDCMNARVWVCVCVNA